MVRFLALFAIVLAVGSCGRSEAPAPAAAIVSSQNANDTRVAKALFGAMSVPSAQPSESFGEYSRGCQAGAVQLPETGPTWQAMRLSRNRNWGQPVLVDYIEDLSAFAATIPGWAGMYVGDMSQPRGGPMASGHASHQTGLDVDIWMNQASWIDLSADDREAISALDFQRAGGAYTNDNWTPAQEALLRAAASDPRVARIFIFAGAKVAMCDHATGDRSWLHKIRPWYRHNDHFHVRLNCPAGATNCVDQAPIPEGDGCDDARAWVNDILNPPPPDPNAEPVVPRPPLTMASLPGQCLDVLNAN
jgi:penicillin-insensitive murein DD-endopeptidase